VEQAERRIKIDPRDGAFWMKLALYRVKSGAGGDAPQLMAKADALGASDVQSQFTKAQVLELLGQRAAAMALLERCLGRGLSEIEIRLIPDLKRLREDPAYTAAVKRAAAKRPDAK
jgi:outer membrane protein TolC